MGGARDRGEADIVIEIRGGNLVEVYTDIRDARVSVVDWDNTEAGDSPGVIVHASLASMPPETSAVARKRFARRHDHA